jgi:phage regulator Rha-like protein
MSPKSRRRTNTGTQTALTSNKRAAGRMNVVLVHKGAQKESIRRAREKALAAQIETLILHFRGERAILDSDLARVYGVTTARLNEQVKRNAERFPGDFMFRLTKREFSRLISQNATSNAGRGGRRKRPFVFTEHGAIMAANVLNSKRAVQMSVFVVRAFVKMRGMLSDNSELAHKLAELERSLKGRLDVHETAIVGILQRIMTLLDPPELPEPKKKPIGFETSEK